MGPIDDIAEIAEVAGSELRHSGWYLARYRDVENASLDAVFHFCRHGWRENRAPNQWFDPGWYLAENPDVAAAGINPLLHYIRHGEREGRRPSAHFDAAWYTAVHALSGDTSALRHYLTHRASGSFSPSPTLWSVPFLPQYRDDLPAGVDPYLHWVNDGLATGRSRCPDVSVVAASGLLDPNFYLINGADVHAAGLDPAEHFCLYGWREHRKPNFYFDTGWYLQTNPTAARLQLNPLVHYICWGEAAGRRSVVYFDPDWYSHDLCGRAGGNAA